MNGNKYKQILYFISVVIIITMCVQGYWTYKNYLSEKKQLITDVQVSLDNAVDSYFTSLAKKHTLNFITDTISGDMNFKRIRLSNINSNIDSIDGRVENIIYKDSGNVKKFAFITTNSEDSINIKLNHEYPHLKNTKSDSIYGYAPNAFEMLASKIVVSISEDSLALGRLDSLIQQELDRKNINLNYGLFYENIWSETQKLRANFIDSSLLNAIAGSSLLTEGSTLKMHYDNITFTVLKRNANSLLISLLLVTSIIMCLLYLLKVIQKQKELAEIKNDLISNITHEFKTPLATISVALEGIQQFNKENDFEKSKKYAQMSRQEVEKLTFMVEKLLETATLDSDSLHIKLEDTDLIQLLEKATTIDAELLNGKTILFSPTILESWLKVDRFHFENAINNIIDNALKYGGDKITVSLQDSSSEIKITITDNGDELTKQHAAKVFEKFYRIPKGNTHDVKGFGIGLYYTKNIIEKHGGTIQLLLKSGTSFMIILPKE